MPSCPCTNWCTTHVLVGTEHVMVKDPSCLIVNDTHVPGLIPCKCKRNPQNPDEWIHDPNCPKHPV